MAFGPVKMAFAGSVSMEERDDAAHRVALKAKGTEQKGKGAANATVTSWLEPIDGGTKVSMQADITLTGAAAQMSRGLLPEVSKRLTQQFADCLEESLAANASAPAATPAADGAAAPSDATAAPADAAAAPKPAPVAAKPVGGIRLGLAAIWSIDRRVLPEAVRRRVEEAVVISGIVLAAGTGSRFGATKQLVEVDGRPLFLHAIDALRDAGVGELILVTGHDAEAVEAAAPPDVSVVRNPAYRDGQSTSLAAALHAVADDSEGAVILMADQPGVGADDVRALIARFRADARADRAPPVRRRARAGAALPRDLRRGRPPPRRRRRTGAHGLAPGLGGRGADRPPEAARRGYAGGPAALRFTDRERAGLRSVGPLKGGRSGMFGALLMGLGRVPGRHVPGHVAADVVPRQRGCGNVVLGNAAARRRRVDAAGRRVEQREGMTMIAGAIASWLYWTLAIIIWIAIAFWPARVAARKGHSFFGFFIFSLIFFPAALIVAYVVKPRAAAM